MSNVDVTRSWDEFYHSAEIVAQYASKTRLQAPERAIFEAIGSEALARSSLLDLGVGGGRTTHELAGRCGHYVGADRSAPMVAACRKRFADRVLQRDVRFEVADARALPFEEAMFDIVFFSYNGIDLVGQGARDQVLAECRRVLRPGGWFVYSSHNLNWMDSRAGIGWTGWRGLRDFVRTQRFWSRMRRLNRAHWPIADQAAVELLDPYGGGYTCYVRPAEMLRQTRAQGFGPIRVFDRSGREVGDERRITALKDAWVYLLCRNEGSVAASR
jgi:SAM-dependent methyltransferase